MSLYTKNKKGEFVPVDINTVLNKDLNNHLVIVRVGTDDLPATAEDLDATASSFSQADVLDGLDNISVIITPYQISMDVVEQGEVDEKTICVQITSGEDISVLDNAMKAMYKKLEKKFKIVVMPAPLKLKEYKQIKETLKRCKMRKKRRSRV